MIIHFDGKETEAQWLAIDNIKIGLFGNTLFVVENTPFDRSVLRGGLKQPLQDCWDF